MSEQHVGRSSSVNYSSYFAFCCVQIQMKSFSPCVHTGTQREGKGKINCKPDHGCIPKLTKGGPNWVLQKEEGETHSHMCRLSLIIIWKPRGFRSTVPGKSHYSHSTISGQEVLEHTHIFVLYVYSLPQM